MFVTASKRQRIKYFNKYGSIRKETGNNTVDGVSVDQLQSAQPVLVPQLPGKLRSAHIWSPK